MRRVYPPGFTVISMTANSIHITDRLTSHALENTHTQREREQKLPLG